MYALIRRKSRSRDCGHKEVIEGIARTGDTQRQERRPAFAAASQRKKGFAMDKTFKKGGQNVLVSHRKVRKKIKLEEKSSIARVNE